jgi:hypothetical protein
MHSWYLTLYPCYCWGPHVLPQIQMYINSPGGVVTAGLAIYDSMQYIRCPVSTLCIGQAASMGACPHIHPQQTCTMPHLCCASRAKGAVQRGYAFQRACAMVLPVLSTSVLLGSFHKLQAPLRRLTLPTPNPNAPPVLGVPLDLRMEAASTGNSIAEVLIFMAPLPVLFCPVQHPCCWLLDSPVSGAASLTLASCSTNPWELLRSVGLVVIVSHLSCLHESPKHRMQHSSHPTMPRQLMPSRSFKSQRQKSLHTRILSSGRAMSYCAAIRHDHR